MIEYKLKKAFDKYYKAPIEIDVKLRTLYRKVDLQEGNTSGFSYGILVGFNFY